MLKAFDSLTHFLDFTAEEYSVTYRSDSETRIYNDFAGKTFDEAMTYARNGNPDYVDAALELYARVNAELPETPHAMRTRSPFGASANMGDWLAGSPTPMRRRVKRPAQGPLNVYVAFSFGGAIDFKTILHRGAAIMALILRAQQTRPVNLVLFEESQTRHHDDYFYTVVPVDSRPLDLSVAAWSVSDPAMFRQLGAFAINHAGGDANVWPVDRNEANYNQLRNERLGLADDDVIIGSMTNLDELKNRPVAWIAHELGESFTGEAD